MTDKKLTLRQLGNGEIRISLLLKPQGEQDGYHVLAVAEANGVSRPIMSAGHFNDIQALLNEIVETAVVANRSSGVQPAEAMTHGEVIATTDDDLSKLMSEDW
jgi:histidinol phosphatase-like enzyme